ncbi:MAG: DUF4443 domain-containing protein [Candidatus Thorarchaeota archaeon]
MRKQTLDGQKAHHSSVKSILNEIVRSNVPMSFNHSHIVVALHLLSQMPPLGRYRLSKELALSGTTARTLLKRLQKHNYVSTISKGALHRGHTLTEKGSALSLKVKERANIFPEPLNLGPLTVGEIDAIVHVSAQWARTDFNPIEARDSAVSMGAKGCTVINFGKKGLEVGDKLLSDDLVHKLLLNNLKPGDLIHVGTADGFEIARLGAVAASLCSWKEE